MPLVIDVLIQITTQKQSVQRKCDETIQYWLNTPYFCNKPTIFAFISCHPVTVPSFLVLENGVVRYREKAKDTRSPQKFSQTKHWLLIISGDDDLSQLIVPILNLVDNSPAIEGERYIMGKRKHEQSAY